MNFSLYYLEIGLFFIKYESFKEVSTAIKGIDEVEVIFLDQSIIKILNTSRY
jgi:hypothetical protein